MSRPPVLLQSCKWRQAGLSTKHRPMYDISRQPVNIISKLHEKSIKYFDPEHLDTFSYNIQVDILFFQVT